MKVTILNEEAFDQTVEKTLAEEAGIVLRGSGLRELIEAAKDLGAVFCDGVGTLYQQEGK